MKKLVFATHNAHKLEELRAIIKNFDIVGLTDINCHEDIVEDADTLDGNAKIKADFVTNNFHVDCFADDTGLEVDALDGAPGVYSARYAGEGCSYQDNVNKLLEAFNIELIDHIIVGGDNSEYFSYKEKGLIANPNIKYATDYFNFDMSSTLIKENKKVR